MQSQPGSFVLGSVCRDSNSKEWTRMLGGLGVDVKTAGLSGPRGTWVRLQVWPVDPLWRQ